MDPFMMVRRVSAAGRKTVEGTLAAPDQIGALWGEVNELVRRVHRLVNRVEHLARRVEHELDRLDAMLVESRGILDDGADVARTGREVADGAGRTREHAEEQVIRVRTLLDLYLPALESLAPVAREAAGLLRPVHLRGLARLLDELPALVDRIEPALDGMGNMAPHLEDMTDRMDNVGQVVEGIPGAKLLKRRGEAREKDEDE